MPRILLVLWALGGSADAMAQQPLVDFIAAAADGSVDQRLAALRAAFEATMKDPALIAEGKRTSVDFKPMKAERIAKLVDGFLKTPPAVVQKAKELSTESNR